MAIPTNLADLNAITNVYIVPRLVDTVWNEAALLNWLLANRRVRFSGGTAIQVPLQYGKLNGAMFTRTTATSFNTAYVETEAALSVNMKYGQVTIGLYGTDDVIQRGREVAVPLVEAKMYNAACKMADLLGSQLYKDGQTSSGDVTTSGGLLSTSSSFDGLLAWIDDGNDSGSYSTATNLTKSFTSVGGVARADLITGSPTAFSSAVTPDDRLFGTTAYTDRAFNSFSLPEITKAIGKAWHGSKSPDLIVGGQAVWNQFSAHLMPMQRIMQKDLPQGNAGFKTLDFQGLTVMVDKLCPAGLAFGLNTSTLQLHISDSKKFQFGFTGFKEGQDTINLAGQVLVAANLICDSPRHNFKLYGTGLS